MYINEIPDNTRVIIRFEQDKRITELDTVTKKATSSVKGRCYKATQICYKDDKIVNPNGFKGTITVSFVPKGATRPEIWKFIHMFYNKATREYFLITQANSHTVERRGHSRVRIGCHAQIILEDRSAQYDCSVHDISATGIGITMPLTRENLVGKRAYVTFKDEKEYVNFTLRAVCVRHVKTTKNMYLYGFRFNNITPDIIEYVKRKQAAATT